MPARLVAKDQPTGKRVEVVFGAYEIVEGVNWPTRMEVRGPEGEFVETLSGWKVSW